MDKCTSPLKLNFAIIPILKQITQKYSVFKIDGTVFDAGVGMLMSCRGVCGKCLLIQYSAPSSDERSEFQEYHTYTTYADKLDELPGNLCIYVHNNVINELEKDESGNLIETIDLIIINLNHVPPLIYAQIM